MAHELHGRTVAIVSGDINEWVGMRLETQARFTDDFPDGSVLMIRPSVYFNLNEEITLSLGYAGVGPAEDPSTWEHRLWQEIRHETNLKGIILVNRSRLEQRFFHGAEGDVSMRLRHLVEAVVPFDTMNPNWSRDWAVVISDEVFFNLNTVPDFANAGFMRNRAFVGVKVKLDEGFYGKFGYYNVFDHRPVSLAAQNADRMSHMFLVSFTYHF